MSLRYELRVSIQFPKIIWVSGPCPCCPYSHVWIFREGLKTNLRVDKLVISVNGYTDVQCIQSPRAHHPSHKILRLIRARHEIMNKRLKQFRVLEQRFRHGKSLHHYCFFAVLQITQLILDDEPLLHIQIKLSDFLQYIQLTVDKLPDIHHLWCIPWSKNSIIICGRSKFSSRLIFSSSDWSSST